MQDVLINYKLFGPRYTFKKNVFGTTNAQLKKKVFSTGTSYCFFTRIDTKLHSAKMAGCDCSQKIEIRN